MHTDLSTQKNVGKEAKSMCFYDKQCYANAMLRVCTILRWFAIVCNDLKGFAILSKYFVMICNGLQFLKFLDLSANI